MTLTTGFIGVIVITIVLVVTAFAGAAWGHWVSRRYTDLLIDGESTARQRQFDVLVTQTAQRFEQLAEDTDSRIDTLEDGAVDAMKSHEKRLTNAKATARRIKRGRDRLRDDKANLRERLRQRIESSSTPVPAHENEQRVVS